MRFLLRITALLMLPPMLMSCASYEFGEYPLTQSEISYFSRVDPSAAIVTDLGGNTFDVYNPTLHADVFWYLGGWSETIPFSQTKNTQIYISARDTFPISSNSDFILFNINYLNSINNACVTNV